MSNAERTKESDHHPRKTMQFHCTNPPQESPKFQSCKFSSQQMPHSRCLATVTRCTRSSRIKILGTIASTTMILAILTVLTIAERLTHRLNDPHRGGQELGNEMRKEMSVEPLDCDLIKICDPGCSKQTDAKDSLTGCWRNWH